MHATNEGMRRFEFAVDSRHLRAVNEVIVHARHFRRASLTMSVLLGLGGAALFLLRHPWSYILGGVLILIAVTALWIGYWAPRRAQRVNDLYAAGALVPAVVAETRPRGAVLLALVDIAKPSAGHPQFALVTRRVRSLPGHQMTLGERIPAIPDLSDRYLGYENTWQVATAIPLAWATQDSDVLGSAISAIDEAQWELLEDHLATWRRDRSGSRHLID